MKIKEVKMATEMTPEKEEWMRKAFEKFDKDGSGFIEVSELGELMRFLGENPTEAEIHDWMGELDTDGSGEVSFEEFAGFMEGVQPQCNDANALIDAFKVFDQNGDGYITSDELVSIVTTKGEMLSEEEAQDMIRELDTDNDNKIDYVEFANLMTKEF